MNRGYKLMKIRNIDIRLDWTLLIVGGLISFSLATGYFPAALPGWGALAYLTAAILSFVGLFGSILLHELAHAIVAQQRGIKVENIMLHLFGGVSQLKEEPRRAKDEFWISVVGPLTSMGLAGLFFAIATTLGGLNPAVGAIGGYLAIANFLLAAFNLIPAYPLDGGRILKALVWGRTGNPVKATRWAAGSGRMFGWGFVGLGFWFLLQGAIFDGFWFILIGWFLISAAKLGYAQTLATVSLKGITVERVMWRSSPALSPEMKLNEAAQLFFQLQPGRLLPVIENGYLLGVLSPEMVRKYPVNDWAQLKVIEVMLRRGSLLAVRPTDELQTTLEMMQAKPALFAAVIDQWGQFAGILYLADVPRYLEMQQRLGLVGPDGERTELNRPRPVTEAQDGAAGTGTQAA